MRMPLPFLGLSLLLLAGASASCTRGPAKSGAMLTISAPDLERMKSAIPAGRKTCFGVNVTGSGISSNVAACSPSTGIIGGYVEPGQNIQVSVPSNQIINVDLYLYLEPQGQSTPCPTMTPTFALAQLANTYLVGSAPNISTASQQVTVDITANFPANSANVAQQLSMPATCQASTSASPLPPSPYNLSAGGTQNLSGQGYNLRAHVGRVVQHQVLSNPGYNMNIR